MLKTSFFLKLLQINPLGTTCLQIHVKTNSVLKLIRKNEIRANLYNFINFSSNTRPGTKGHFFIMKKTNTTQNLLTYVLVLVISSYSLPEKNDTSTFKSRKIEASEICIKMKNHDKTNIRVTITINNMY